jgi:hypothetical protein
MPDNYARRRFALPADWSPDELWCVTLWIPGTVDYLDTLTGHLTDLGNSKNFERDATKTGAATVARTWRKALDFEPPRIGNCAPPVNSPVLTTQAEKDDYAAMVIYFIRHALLEPFVTCAGLSTSCADCVDAVMIDLANYGGGASMRSALMNLCAAVQSATPSEITAAQSECLYSDEFDDLASKVGNPYDWLNKLSDWLFNWLNSTSSNLFNALNNAAGVIGGNGIQGWIDDHGGVTEGGGAGFGGDCTWSHTWDFTSSTSDWYPLQNFPGYDSGQYATGLGWKDVSPPPIDPIRFLYIALDVSHVTHVSVTYDYTALYHLAACDIRVSAGPGFTGGTLSTATDYVPNNDPVFNRVFAADVSSAGGCVMLSQNSMASFTIKSVTLTGTGPDPYP